ncbi:hypothetical protein E2C01_077212 [Portunus trituberculatus]|uniref:Transmembrane protein n=1 Tax=Portunus trituberculatus TaxID=210409 RepID=A0A5B7IDT2_PORTR|nr:hypothetical protein [Portunus trituberculatus]
MNKVLPSIFIAIVDAENVRCVWLWFECVALLWPWVWCWWWWWQVAAAVAVAAAVVLVSSPTRSFITVSSFLLLFFFLLFFLLLEDFARISSSSRLIIPSILSYPVASSLNSYDRSVSGGFSRTFRCDIYFGPSDEEKPRKRFALTTTLSQGHRDD